MTFHTGSRKAIIWLITTLCTFSMVRGCGFGTLQWAFDQIEPSSLLNTDALGIPDITGRRNPILPDFPDWDDDPTCVIPGYCGPSPFYPFSTGEPDED